MAGSLESHLHRERGSSGSPRLPAPSRVPFQPPSPQPDPPQTREHNPFGSPANPFGDQDDEDLSPDNPFAAEANQRQSSKREEDREGEDYDESLNPFAAS